jgi:diazepam-binding inhibitor (GABA receptor modulating acyl-CoA-binding protein)
MGLQEEFKQNSDKVKKLKERPSNDELLSLYAHYKQATDGDASGSRPGMFNLKERAKWDAWAAIKGVSKDKAMEKYNQIVTGLIKKLGSN